MSSFFFFSPPWCPSVTSIFNIAQLLWHHAARPAFELSLSDNVQLVGCPTWSELHCQLSVADSKPWVGLVLFSASLFAEINAHYPIWKVNKCCESHKKSIQHQSVWLMHYVWPASQSERVISVAVTQSTMRSLKWTLFVAADHSITSESPTAVMTVVIAAVQTRNRPNDLRQLNNSRSRCCGAE